MEDINNRLMIDQHKKYTLQGDNFTDRVNNDDQPWLGTSSALSDHSKSLQKVASGKINQSASPFICDEIFKRYAESDTQMTLSKQKAQIMCRICAHMIKVTQLHQHVQYCQKNFSLSHSISEMKQQLSTFAVQLRDSYPQADFKIKIVIDELLRTKRPKNLHRGSCLQGDSQLNLDMQLKGCISELKRDKVDGFDAIERYSSLQRRIAVAQRQTFELQRTFLFGFSAQKVVQESLNQSQQVQDANKNLVSGPVIDETDSDSNQESESQESASTFSNSSNSSFSCMSSSSCVLSKLGMQKLKVRPARFSILQHEQKFRVKRANSIGAFWPETNLTEFKAVSYDSFKFIKLLGKGAFGKVYLARRVETKDLYAIKVIRLTSDKQLQSVNNQIQIFKKIAGEHLVKAPFAFTQGGACFLVMEYMPGGDLRKILDQQVYFEEDAARIYLAQVVLGIEHLHKAKIIHRDLKPENLVFDASGHLKLTDFGLSEIKVNHKLKQTRQAAIQIKQATPSNKGRRQALINRCKNPYLIGTPDYIAPEIIKQLSFSNPSLDWWSLGVIAYQVLVGVRPFSGDTVQEVLENILKRKIEWPQVGYGERMMSPEAYDLIDHLLVPNFGTRLGSDGVHQIKSHPFFKGLNWSQIKQNKSPYAPSLQLASCPSLEDDSADQAIRDQISEIVKQSFDGAKNVDSFVRFDLLGAETVSSAERVFKELLNYPSNQKYSKDSKTESLPL